MVKSDFFRVDFPTLQAIVDLQAFAGSFPAFVADRILAGVDSPDAPRRLRAIVDRGCVFAEPEDMELHAALVFAATLPNDDYAGFLLSTSVLLADRLQGGLGTDDLFWHWDAFRAHYRIAEVVPRVTIMQGFRRANINGRVALFDPPELFELTSYSHDETLGKLAAVDPEFAAFGKLIAQSLSDPGAYRNEGMRHAHAAVSGKVPAAITLGIRAIYETIDTWDPEPDLTFDPSGPLPVMLPGPGA